IREAAYRSVGATRKRALHGAAGHALMKRRTTPSAVIAMHYNAAGLSELAYSYALAASEESGRVDGRLEVEHFLQMAYANASDQEQLTTVIERLATLMHEQGRYAEAEAYCRELAELEVVAKNPIHLLRVDTSLLALAFKQGSLPAAELDNRI